MASVITAIVTALLATVILFVLICKCHPKFKPGGVKSGTSAEGQEYEEMEVGVASSDPTYMEVGRGDKEGGGGDIVLQLKENEAYATCKN